MWKFWKQKTQFMGLLEAIGNLHIINVVLCALIGVVFTLWFIPRILVVSFKKKLFDFADERKVHTGVVPRFGGVAFVPSILVSVSLMAGISSLVLPGDANVFVVPTLQMAFGLCSLILLYFEGIMDDLVGLRYRVKFVIQILCALLIVASGIWLNDFHGLFGLAGLSPWFGVPFSVLLVVFIINAINLIDGIDGLASGLSIVSAFFFGIMFCYEGYWGFAMLAFSLMGTLVPFFYYNVFGDAQKRRKIFMGDTGSQCVGLILSVLAIRLSMTLPDEQPKISGIIIVAFSMLLVPAFDVVRVMIHRFRRHKNVFEADNSHIHHKLLMLGMTHKVAMITILVISMFFVMMNLVLLKVIDINVILLLDIFIWTAFNILLTKAINKKRSEENRF